jgi:hypothetical protein
MFIIGILIALAIPAIRGLGSSTGFSTGGRQISSALTHARSSSIGKRTVIRFGIVTDWQGKPEAAYKKYSTWQWDRDEEDFVQNGSWETLPNGLVFEPEKPDYLKNAAYASKDGSSIRGDFVPDSGQKEFETKSGKEIVRVAYLEFTPSGGARVEDGDFRNILMTLAQGYVEQGNIVYTQQKNGKPTNWAQFNIDTLTGRVRIYRP